MVVAAWLLLGCGGEVMEGEVEALGITAAAVTFPVGALRVENATAGVDYVADEIVVGFKAGLFSVAVDNPANLSPEAVKTLHRELQRQAGRLAGEMGYELRDTSPAVPVALMRLPAGTTPLAAISRLRGDRRLAFVEVNALARVSTTIPSDPDYSLQKAHLTDVGAQRAWDMVELSDYSPRIAVIDTGFHFEHPDRWTRVSDTEDRDFVTPGPIVLCPFGGLPSPRDWDGLGYDGDATEVMDLELALAFPCPSLQSNPAGSHGTKVAGTIGAWWGNGQGGVGVLGRLHLTNNAARPTIIPIQVFNALGTSTSYDIGQGILYASGLPASNGAGGTVTMLRADIANMSFGGPLPTIYQALMVMAADLSGVLLIAASGNKATAAPAAPSFPAWWPPVISVSAVAQDETLASFSNFGKVELTAPGVDIRTTQYDYSGCSTVLWLPCVAAFGGVPGYGQASGTSLAAPHVAAIAALYKMHDDSLTSSQLRALLLANAADLGPPGPDIFFGAGLVQAAPGRGVGLVANHGPVTAYLVNRTTGAILSTPVTALSNNFQFLNVPAGEYYTLAASDPDGDGRFGETAESLGASGGGGLQNARTQLLPAGNFNGTVNFSLGWPEQEPEPLNDGWAGAGTTFVGFYAEATYSGANDTDWFTFVVPSNGLYRIWTEGRNTIECRELFNEMNPSLSLYHDPLLAPLASDSNSGEGDCAEISAQLTAGTKYFVAVTSEGSAPAIGDATILHIDGP